MAEGGLDPLSIDKIDLGNAVGLAILIGCDYEKTKKGFVKLEGPKNDIDKAKKVFSSFGAYCLPVWNNTAEGIIRIILTAARRRYPPSVEWIVTVISGHGKEGIYQANDGKQVDLQKNIIDPFKPENALSIAKCKKLFFIDTCRGDNETDPVVIPRGGKGIDTMITSPDGDFLVAYSTLPKKLAYELAENREGLWITRVLTRLEQTDESVTDVLCTVNKDIIDHYNKRYKEVGRMSIQQPEFRSTLIGPFKFQKLPRIQLELQSSQSVQSTKELKELASKTERMEIKLDKGGKAQPKQIKKSAMGPTVGKKEWLQEIKNVLVDKEGWTITKDNYREESKTTSKNQNLYRYTFSHPRIPNSITGEWRNSKQDAKQNVAKLVLTYYYEQQ